jgi:hypothetical protein
MKAVPFVPCIAAAAVLTLACGGGTPRRTPAAGGLDTLRLVPADTIGVEYGDSALVFGMVLSAEADAHGRTLVLDPLLCRLSAFDGRGKLLAAAGGRGSGPGELQFPMDMAVLEDGRVVVSDMQRSQMCIYDGGLQHEKTLSGFFPTAPMFLDGACGSLFVAVDMVMDMEADPPEIRWRAGVWSPDSAGPRTVLASLSTPASAAPDPGEPQEELSVAASDSLVFVGYVSVDRFLVEVYGLDGTPVSTVEKPWDRMERTPEERERGGMTLSITRDNTGESTTEAGRTGEVCPWRSALEQVAAGPDGRLWVELGSRPFTPTFEVYDPRSGELEAVVVADSSLAAGRISVSDGGFLHYDPNPEDYPRVVRLVLEESPR